MSKINKIIPTYYIVTFGCQMNEADSQKIAQVFENKGYRLAKSTMAANIVIVNTCSVRESAENRVGGFINNIKNNKLDKQKIIVTGCVMRYPLNELKHRFPGTDEFIKFKDLIKNLPYKITSKSTHAWVKIMEGCDNYCTYCVVPSARGREISRSIEEIYCEVCELVKRGVKEITLLGQNVNSYHKNAKLKIPAFESDCSTRLIQSCSTSESSAGKQNLQKKYSNNFAILLALLHDIKGLEKIKFMTSNPQDLSNDIINAMKLKKIDRYLHLPVQSGDDEILKKMNRKYTAKQYLKLINNIREKIKDIEIGTDIIVGFPGETEKQFQNTIDLCKKAKFVVAFIGKYSPRPSTPAFKLKDNVSMPEKKRRWRILENLINKPNLILRNKLIR